MSLIINNVRKELADDLFIKIAIDHVTGHPEGTEHHESKEYKIRLGTYLVNYSGECGSHEVVVTEENIRFNIRQLLEGSTFLYD